MTMMSDPPGLRLDPLRAWLRDQDLPFDSAGPIRADLFPGGRSNVTYRLTDAAGRSIVLRRPPLGHVLPSAHDMAREFTVLTGLNRVGYPVPQAYSLCEDTEVIDSAFILMSFVDGRVIADRSAASLLTPSEADAISATLISAMVRLHDVDAEAAGLMSLGRPQGYLRRQLARWSGQWELTKTREQPAIDDLRNRLDGVIGALPDDFPWSIVHGDFRLDNSVLRYDSAEVLAVLDWEMSTLGDPLADLGLTLLYWTRPGDNLRKQVPIAPGVTEQPGFWDRDRVIEAYAKESGRSVDQLDACTALACFKLAVIAESIHTRAMRGQQLGTAADDQEGMGAATAAIAQIGLNVVRSGTVAGLAS